MEDQKTDSTPPGDNATKPTEIDENATEQMGLRVRIKHKKWFENFKKNFVNAAEAFEFLINEASKDADQKPQPEKEVVEVIREVPVELTGTQFICELRPDVFEKARKIRQWVYKSKVLKDENPQHYANELVNHAVEHLAKDQYSHIINR